MYQTFLCDADHGRMPVSRRARAPEVPRTVKNHTAEAKL
jgi:hypothetical protein